MTFPNSALWFLVASFALSGCAGSPNETDPGTLDTGMIAPGGEKTLAFADARFYEMHCDPHPFMKHNVTAQAGSASAAHVHILDGNSTRDYRFDPQDLTVAAGALVAYHNHGSFSHTATEGVGDEHGGH